MPERARRIYPQQRVYAVATVVFGLIAAVLWVIAVPLYHRPVSHSSLMIGGALLILAFATTETLSLRIEVRKETFLVSLSELASIYGLIILPGWVVGVAHVVASVIVFRLRRDNWRAVRINFVVIAVESGVGAIIAAGLPIGWDQHNHPILGAAVGGVVAAMVSSQAVWATYSFMGTPEPFVRMLTRSLVAACSCAIFALVAYTLCNTTPQPTGYILCAGLGALIIVLYRTYAKFLRQHTDLSRMYSFGRNVAEVGSSASDWHGLIEQVRDQLNAKVALVHLNEPTSGFQTLSVGSDGVLSELPPEPLDPLLALATRDGRAQVSSDRTADKSLLAALRARDAWDVLVVPLRSGDRDRGYLEVRDRLSRWGRFRENDLTLLETLASHFATALDNMRLLETLRHEAYHDEITGLLNWRGLAGELESSMATGSISAVMLVQLDILPEVNNAIGHDRGEQLLSAAGLRLVAALGQERLVAHIESDRFAVLIPSTPEGHLLDRASDLLTVVGRPYALDGIEVEPHAHAGIAHVAVAGGVDGGASAVEDVSTLLQRAEMALMAAQSSDEPIRTYGASMGQVFRRRFQLVTQFRKAVEDGLITVHYQPKLSLSDRELAGVEALVRWTHPEFGPVSPSEFVEAIEATGSIDTLLRHVLEIVLAQVAEWRRRNMKISAAVNLSVRNLSGPNFPQVIRAALDAHGVPPELLTFEITESSVMADPERSLPILRELHSMGIRLSVDDFGTGYSSLAYLRRLPIDEIKIDKSFVQGMVTDLSDHAIVRAIIDLGHSLGLRVIAEGVEEEAARDALRALHCDEMQGFLLARPMPIEKLEAWLASRTVRTKAVGTAPQMLRLVG
ncbi:diguanylate cyclase (GGDEF) domain-containing protein [Nakamurella panacisegetis]|uniref:Diguanylate cyclase (GGDEF) domain-containing protein n=1 Tax=Nakamurella panacisegetis TaxID=1090615 RepID=A0A1H0NVS8_9ACTN|nr:EAL domain-containing protein [Nakamurella panacisegetis]SDO96626.1 diguanylate cyclase (GGDEF) domain-containing protein [Nakamurella panacisegetis]